MADDEDESEWLNRLIAADAERVRKMLAMLLDLLGLSQRTIERRLGLPRGYVSNVLTGRVELKLAHVTAILLAADLHPALFYGLAYPKERPVGHLVFTEDYSRRLSALGAFPPPSPPEPGPPPTPLPRTVEELNELIDTMIQKALTSRRKAPRKTRPRRATKGNPNSPGKGA